MSPRSDRSASGSRSPWKRRPRAHLPAFRRWQVVRHAHRRVRDARRSACRLPTQPKVVGIDLGLKTFATSSPARKTSLRPKFFRKGQRKLRKAQRVLSRRKPGSKRKAKAKLTVARVHQRIANQRGDFLHKLTTRLVSDNDGICIEDLSLKGLARTKLAKSFTDASMGEFRRQLEYKSEWNRKHLVVIDRFFPSTRLCRGCGVVNSDVDARGSALGMRLRDGA